MNKRIKELWDEANSRYYQSESDQPLPQFIFAELIVKECAGIVNSLEQYEGPGDCSTAEYIKEHFGV